MHTHTHKHNVLHTLFKLQNNYCGACCMWFGIIGVHVQLQYKVSMEETNVN